MQSLKYTDKNLSVIDTKRNPYLVDYERERRRKMQTTRQVRPNRQGRGIATKSEAFRSQPGEHQRIQTGRSKASARARRRKQMYRRRMVAAGIFCLVISGVILFCVNKSVSAAADENDFKGTVKLEEKPVGEKPDSMVQGLSAQEFAAHPVWTEDFLTPNEYSRPGDALDEVKNIFVHYTANPGTSAAQNRSYFEQQKDEHEASVSAHFIIGYDGEIIQCLPLDEIGYAVQTRNYDSISIECCYKAKDGSFTQATYDSLISLLAWLTDVYDLGTEDILRHYDCGGKKCPLYYTENPKEWEELKEDVAEARL